jgi:hypothetical protein
MMLRADATGLRIAALAALLLAGSCTQLSRAECEAGDWQTIGQRDGRLGHDAGFVARHVERCGGYGITVDTALWEQGRQDGLKLFCTPQSQYDRGRAGKPFNPICAAENLPEHRAAYDKGRRYFELTQRIEMLQSDIRHLRRTDSRTASLEIFMTQMDIDRLERERRQYESL